MSRRVPCVLMSIWMLISAAPPAGAVEWLAYQNPRYGTVVEVPASGFIARPPSANGDGQEWESADGLGQILVFADLIVTVDTLSAYRRETLGYARDDGVDIVYDTAKAGWFAYSGYLGDDIIYEKVVVTQGCDPMVANHVYFRYPTSQKERYDPVVRRMAATLGGSEAAGMCARY